MMTSRMHSYEVEWKFKKNTVMSELTMSFIEVLVEKNRLKLRAN